MFQPAMIPANGAIEAAISIAVLVIAFIGWLVQIVGQAKGLPAKPANGRPANAPRPARAAGNAQRPRDDRLQSEIDSFLREVSTGKKARKKDEDEVAVEVIPIPEDAQPPRRLAEQVDRFNAPSENTVGKIFQDAKASTGAEDDRRQYEQQRDRLLLRLRERHLESSPLGSALQKNVEETIAEAETLRAEKLTAERKLAEATAELSSLRARQGFQGGSGSAGNRSVGSRSRVGALLRNQRTVKDAIVINEVLSRPKGLRKQL